MSKAALVDTARKHGITSPAQIEAMALRLSRNQAALYCALREKPEVSTLEIRQQALVGNISETAGNLNRKLKAAGDPRRVVCETRPHENKFGERGVLGWWALVEVEDDVA